MYTIKLADGTTLNRLELNGNNFISDDEIPEAVFKDNLSYVEITDDDGHTVAYHDMVLIQCHKWTDGRTWFILAEKPEPTPAELQQENKLLKAQVQALNTNQEFLENCLVEVGQIIYA